MNEVHGKTMLIRIKILYLMLMHRNLEKNIECIQIFVLD